MSCETPDGIVHVAVTFKHTSWPLCALRRGTSDIDNRPKPTKGPRSYPKPSLVRAQELKETLAACPDCLIESREDLVIVMDSGTTRRRQKVSPWTVLKWRTNGKLTFTPLRHPGSSRRMYTQAQVEELKKLASSGRSTGMRKLELELIRAEEFCKRLGITRQTKDVTVLVSHGIAHDVRAVYEGSYSSGVFDLQFSVTRCGQYIRYSKRTTGIGQGDAALKLVNCIMCLGT